METTTQKEQFIKIEEVSRFSKIYNYLMNSSQIQPNSVTDEPKENAVMSYLFEQIEKRINKETKLDKSFILSSELLAGFSPKSPAQKQKESQNQAPKGYAALFQNLTSQ